MREEATGMGCEWKNHSMTTSYNNREKRASDETWRQLCQFNNKKKPHGLFLCKFHWFQIDFVVCNDSFVLTKFYGDFWRRDCLPEEEKKIFGHQQRDRAKSSNCWWQMTPAPIITKIITSPSPPRKSLDYVNYWLDFFFFFSLSFQATLPEDFITDFSVLSYLRWRWWSELRAADGANQEEEEEVRW